MFIKRSGRRLVVAVGLRFLLVLASADTGLTQDSGTGGPSASSPGAAIDAADTVEVPRLRLALFNAAGLPAEVSAKAQRRTEEILGQLGVTIEWYEPNSTSNADEQEEPYYLKVILFDKPAAAMGHPAAAMGVAFHTDSVPDAVWLFDPVIRQALQRSARRSRPLSSEELGRAYGRVIAHEVIHAVANDMRHAAFGVMAPTQNRKLLLSSSAAVDTESEESFLEGLARIQQSLASARR